MYVPENPAVAEALARITVNEQSSIRIAGEKTLYFDPFRLTTAPRDADAIFITHAHFDHFSPEDIEKVRRADTVFVVPASMAEQTAALGVPPGLITALLPGGTSVAAGVPVEAVPAYNLRKTFHPKANGWLGYIVETAGVRVYVAGDTDATPEAAAVRCDIALLPIGGKYTMDAKEARALAERLAPAAAVATHYGTVVGAPSDYDTFAKKLPCAVKKLFIG